MVARVLETRYRVLKNEGNLNNHIGVPLSLLRLTPAHDVAVLEMGMNHAGEIARLAEIAAPQAGVFTIVGPVHLEHFDSIDGIAAAKRELAEALPAGGAMVLNADDRFVRHFGDGFGGQKAWYGTRLERAAAGDITVRIVAAQCGEAGSEVVLQVRRGSALHPGEELLDREVRFHLPLLGRHNVANAAAAVAAGVIFGVAPEAAASALAGMRPAAQRGEVERLGGLTIINDSYNSNPPAVEQMLGVLRQAPGRRIAVLGEMLELGPAAGEMHRAVGRLLGQDAGAEGGIAALFTVRGHAREIAEGAREAGFSGFMAHTESPQECGAALRDFLQPGDVVLLKASRGVRLEGVMDFIRQAPAASVEGLT
jgi:UDP-N-acetylmuramoyl-tripeptide--D-alanyl-D-alanine ligase